MAMNHPAFVLLFDLMAMNHPAFYLTTHIGVMAMHHPAFYFIHSQIPSVLEM
jgi:hypothetical protein